MEKTIIVAIIGVLIFAIGIVVGLIAFKHKPSETAKERNERIRKEKWNALQQRLQSIDTIHDRVIGIGEKLERTEMDTARREIATANQEFSAYLAYCEKNSIEPPSEQDAIRDLLDTTEYEIAHPKEMLDKELEFEGRCYSAVYKVICAAGQALHEQRQAAVNTVEQVEALVNSIANRPKAFDTEITEIVVQKQQFLDTVAFGIEQRKAFEAAGASAGAGVAAGAAVAAMAPTAAMWVATTFGVASTGTAISALSGVAATNAALAWLGGGAIVAGGGGMAAGNALLALAGPVGWGIAGASLAASAWFAWHKKQEIREKKFNEIVRLKKCVESLKEMNGTIRGLTIETAGIHDNLINAIDSLRKLAGRDYSSFTDEQKKALGALVNNTKSLSVLLNVTLSEQGDNNVALENGKK